MQAKLKRASALLLTLAMVLSLAVPACAAEAETADYDGWDTIKVFETTDVHGWIADVTSYQEDTFQYRLAYIAHIVEEARANEDYDGVLLLDGGDIYQGTPLSNLTRGAALKAAMDEMDYDAVALGNHEFDWDVTQYAVDAEGTMPAYEIGDFSGDSDIPVVTYNIADAATGEPVSFLKDHVVVEKGGYKIAIVGYADEYSADIMTSKISPYTIDEDLAKLDAKAAEIKAAEEADIVIILAHADPKHIADALDPEVVDLVVGGHTHASTVGVSEDTGIAYIQGNNQAKGYATAEIKIDPETKEVAVVDPSYVSISEKDMAEDLYYKDGANELLDPEVAAITQAGWDAVKDEVLAPLVTADKEITRYEPLDGDGDNLVNTTAAGSFLAGLMLKATEDLDTVAAFVNPGGIRTEFTFADGETSREITIADIYTIAPFENIICTYAVTGPQLKAQLEAALKGDYASSNYGSQFAGISVEFVKVPDGVKVTRVVTDDGEEIDLTDETTTHNICTYIYCATLPGSPLADLTPLQSAQDSPVDNQAYIAVLEEMRDAGETDFTVDTTVRHICTGSEIPPIATVTDAEGNTYYRLRDIAYAFVGTEFAFDVDWVAGQGVIVTAGGAYDDGQLAASPAGEAVPTTMTVTAGGETAEYSAMFLGNNNYLTQEDLAELVGSTAIDVLFSK